MQDIILSPIPLDQLTEAIAQKIQSGLKLQSENAKTPPQPDQTLITRKQAAALLGVSLPTLLDWTKTGKIQGYRIGSRVRYKKAEIEQSLIEIKHTNKG